MAIKLRTIPSPHGAIVLTLEDAKTLAITQQDATVRVSVDSAVHLAGRLIAFDDLCLRDMEGDASTGLGSPSGGV